MFKFKKISISIILSLIISGCNTQESGFEKYPIPKLSKVLQNNNTYNIDTKWWQGYNDKILNNLIEQALQNNTDLAQTAIDVNLALYKANLLGADLVPTFSSSTLINSSKNLKNGLNTNSISSNISISYEIDLWKSLADSRSAGVWNYKATQENLEEAKLVLINNIISNYFNLQYLNEYSLIIKENINNYQQILNMTNNKFNNGIISNLDLIEAQQALTEEINSLNDINLQIKQTQQTLKNLLNYSPKQNIPFDKKSILDLKLIGVDLNVPISTISNRPDIKSQEDALLSLFKDKTAEEKSIYPNIILSSSLSTSSSGFNNSINNPLGALGISINLPFLDWNHLKWNIKTSQANFEKQEYAFYGSITNALNEVDTLYYTYKNSYVTYQNDMQIYKNSQKITLLYKRRYNSGISSMDDYLDALKNENSYKQNFLIAKYNLIINENNIYKAMAGKYKK